MNRVYICGQGTASEYVKKQFAELEKNEIAAFVDSNITKKRIDEYRVIDFKQLLCEYNSETDIVCLSNINGNSIAEIIKYLQINHINNIYVLKRMSYELDLKMTSVDDGIVFYKVICGKNDIVLPFIQVILTRRCNSNCKGCTHFANIYNKEKDCWQYNINQLKSDIDLITKHTEVIKCRFLGGEPFLYDNIKDILPYVRKKLPYSEIDIVTNGIEIVNCDDELLDIISKEKINIYYSVYPTTQSIRNIIIEKLKEKNINVVLDGVFLEETKEITEFSKFLSKNEVNPNEALLGCSSKQCRTLMDGKMYKCQYDALSYGFYNYFGLPVTKSIPFNIRDQIDKNVWKNECDRLLTNVVDNCKYCSPDNSKFKWEQTNDPQIGDWIIEK